MHLGKALVASIVAGLCGLVFSTLYAVAISRLDTVSPVTIAWLDVAGIPINWMLLGVISITIYVYWTLPNDPDA